MLSRNKFIKHYLYTWHRRYVFDTIVIMKEDETIDKLVNQELSVFELTDQRCKEVLIEIVRQLRKKAGK